MSGQIRIGTSGFSYRHWTGVFYPEDLPQKRWLEFYAELFDTVELNVTFYRLPTEAAFRAWAERVPAGFLYAVKLSRYITHLKRLHDARESLDLFLSRTRLLGEHLGVILVQLPPGLHRNVPLLDQFLDACDPTVRWAVEFRHASWLHDETYDALSRHRAALCIHDLLPDHPRIVTADFTYARFHGVDQRYGGSYSEEGLRGWAKQMRAWRENGLDVFAYFNNDVQGYAVQNARTMREMLS